MKKVRDWNLWLEEQRKKETHTAYDVFLDAVQSVGVQLGKKYKWDRVDVAMGAECVHMSYVKGSSLFCAMIPVTLITRSLMILPYMETAVLQMEKEILEVEKRSKKH